MNPYDPAELGRHDSDLDGVAFELERHAASAGGEPPPDLAGRVMSAIGDEPIPSSRWAWLGDNRGPVRLLAAAVVIVVAIAGALAIGSLIEQARPNVGGPPTPAVLPSPSETPAPTPTVSPSPSLSPTPTVTPPTVSPSPSDDDDEVETPEPSESDDDNSGPGGGGDDDSSGPGSGDDRETPEPSGDDNSGPGGGG
jgi:hypothetical protein